MKYLINKSSKMLSYEQGSSMKSEVNAIQSERIQSTRSEVEHIHAEKISFLQEKAQENQEITCHENQRVAELKMKAAELS